MFILDVRSDTRQTKGRAITGAGKVVPVGRHTSEVPGVCSRDGPRLSVIYTVFIPCLMHGTSGPCPQPRERQYEGDMVLGGLAIPPDPCIWEDLHTYRAVAPICLGMAQSFRPGRQKIGGVAESLAVECPF